MVLGLALGATAAQAGSGPADADRPPLFATAVEAVKARVFRLPQPLGTAPAEEERRHEVVRAGKGDRLAPPLVVPALPAPPAAAAPPPAADPVTVAALPPAAAAVPAAPVAADRRPLPAIGLAATPPLVRHGPRDPVTGEAEAGGPGSFPPLLDVGAPLFLVDPKALPPGPFDHLAPPTVSLPPPPAADGGAVAKGLVTGDLAVPASPAERLGLSGDRLARAETCMAEAVYFESRGEPVRGQVAVAQVVINRVFSGHYPSDVCEAVYQNAHRRLACQFTFACDGVPDVVRDAPRWQVAKAVARDMLAGRSWLDEVGKATHYHAHWVRPDWVREMTKIERIGVHTFYRPRAWQGWEGRS